MSDPKEDEEEVVKVRLTVLGDTIEDLRKGEEEKVGLDIALGIGKLIRSELSKAPPEITKSVGFGGTAMPDRRFSSDRFKLPASTMPDLEKDEFTKGVDGGAPRLEGELDELLVEMFEKSSKVPIEELEKVPLTEDDEKMADGIGDMVVLEHLKSCTPEAAFEFVMDTSKSVESFKPLSVEEKRKMKKKFVKQWNADKKEAELAVKKLSPPLEKDKN